MKSKKSMKRSLTAAICVGMLFNPVFTTYSASFDITRAQKGTAMNSVFLEIAASDKTAATEATDADVEKNPMVQLNIKDNDIDKEYIGLQFTLWAYVYGKEERHVIYETNCARYDTGDKSNIKVEIPVNLYNKYNDKSKYSIYFYIKNINVEDEYYVENTGTFTYKGEENESHDIILKRYRPNCEIMKGSLNLIPPEKLEYKIGEELDLNGGYTLGAGVFGKSLDDMYGNWDDFGKSLSLKDFDAYNFDNSRPGEYVIKYNPRYYYSIYEHDIFVKPNEFTVTVVESERPEGATTKISIVDANTAESIKDVKAVLFKCTNNKKIDTQKDEIIAMWNTSVIPERMFTETNFSSDKYYYIGFEYIPDEYECNIRRSDSGYKFSTNEFFSFEEDKENTVWTVKLIKDIDIVESSTSEHPTEIRPVNQTIWGDANCDYEVDLSDAILIMQSIANPNKYGLGGTSLSAITEKGKLQADVDTSVKGVTGDDAVMIQEYLLKKISSLEPSE